MSTIAPSNGTRPPDTSTATGNGTGSAGTPGSNDTPAPASSARASTARSSVSVWRRRVRGLSGFPMFAGLIVLLTPVAFVNDRFRRWRSSGSDGGVVSLPRVPAADADLEALMRAGRPVIVEGLAESVGVADAADLDALRAIAADGTEPFKVNFHRAEHPYFLYTGDYGAELDHSTQMDLAGFLELMFESDELDPASSDVCVYKLFGTRDLDGAVSRAIATIADGLAGRIARRTEPSASGVWIGSTGVVTPLHHDAWPGLLFQYHGSKRVVMYSPADRPNLYFSSPFDHGSRWSQLPARSSEADGAEFPLAERAVRHEGRLEAGEALFIPPYWSHEVEALAPNISIPFRFNVGAAERLNPGFLRPACEVMHGSYLNRLKRLRRTSSSSA